MKKQTEQALTVPAETITPPLRREEIIEGLLILGREKHEAEKKVIKEKVAELREQWDAECAKLLPKGAPNFRDPHIYSNHEVKVTISTTDKMKKIGAAFDKLRTPHWDEDAQRKLIAEDLKRAGNRASMILSNPAMRKAFEAMSRKIGLLD